MSAGRPKVTDKPDVVSLLVTSFHSGMTVRDACRQSGISHEAYYSRLRSDEQFADTMATAQVYATYEARRVIVDAIKDGNISAAKWWLERKAKDEFSLKITVEPENIDNPGAITPEDTRTELTQMLANLTHYRDYQVRSGRTVDTRLAANIQLVEAQLVLMDVQDAE